MVLWRSRASAAREDVERRATHIAGALLFALSVFVAITSVTSLLGYSEPSQRFWGSPFRSQQQSYAVACEREAAAVRNHG